jgi:hypothetical protein
MCGLNSTNGGACARKGTGVNECRLGVNGGGSSEACSEQGSQAAAGAVTNRDLTQDTGGQKAKGWAQPGTNSAELLLLWGAIPDPPTFRCYLAQRQALNLQQAINRR